MFTALQHIAQEISVSLDSVEALHFIVERIQGVLQADSCNIFLIDEESGEYVLIATIGLDPGLIGKLRIKFGVGLIGLIGEREEPVNVADVEAQSQFHKEPYITKTKCKAFLGVPIIDQGKLQGVLVVHQSRQRVYLEEEEAFLITLAVRLADDIANARRRGTIAKLLMHKRRSREMIVAGIPGALGVGVGEAVVVYPPADLDAVPDRNAEDIVQECSQFSAALLAAREEIHQLRERARTTLSITEQALFDVYLHILDSQSLVQEVFAEIETGKWAQSALKQVINRHILRFESLEDPYLKERAADFRDLGRRVLANLQRNRPTELEYPKNTILVSEEVTATALLEVPEGRLVGIISGSGSSSSHVAILARALGIPAVMSVSAEAIELNGQEVIVDGYNGHVYVAPNQALKKEFQLLAMEEQQLDEELEALRDLPAQTEDGHIVKLYINTGLAINGELSLSVGAEGVGLYRTEMPFMMRDRFPSEQEQLIMYRQLLTTFYPRPVIMRTLDIGGDKILPYFSMQETNPFLGWRGIRVTLDHPEIFLPQLRAMLQANIEVNNLSIMLPMVASVSEVEAARYLLKQAYEELIAEGAAVKMPPLGIMVEVPAAIYQAYELANRVDFLSVGSNDLIQYLLAVDRNNSRVAAQYNGLHPAVLRALQQVVKGGHKAGKPVSICGELASDPVAAVLLIAMGFDTLSMSAKSVPRIKWVIRKFTLARAKDLLEEVLKMDDPVEIRCHMELVLEEAGLAGLIRAGKR